MIFYLKFKKVSGIKSKENEEEIDDVIQESLFSVIITGANITFIAYNCK